MLEYDRSKRKWILYTRDGSRILGTHKTKKDALRQERAILWSQSKRKRKNPLVERKGGLIVSPGSAEGLWYHGSISSKPLAQFEKPPAPFSYHNVTFFSSSKKFGENFATDSGARDGGWVHVVAVRDVPIFDVDDMYIDRLTENWSLTDKGQEFADTLAEVMNQYGTMSDDYAKLAVQRVMSSLRRGNWIAFDQTDEFYMDLMETLKELGYRGWLEYEEGALNLALLRPDEDASIVQTYRPNPMLSFTHHPVWGDYPDTHPYLHNPVTGGTTFYHVAKGEGCAFDKPMLTFFGLTKGYVQEFFGIHPDQSDREWTTDPDAPTKLTICEVRFRNTRWANIFDIANYIESIDATEYPNEEMNLVELTAKGREIKRRTGFPFESYSYEYFLNYRERTGRQLIADLNRLGYGPFYGFLEDEYTEKQPPCDEDDYDCLSGLHGYDEDSTRSDSPLTLALDFRLGRNIIVELVRYEVVDARGRKLYGEDLDDPFDDDNEPVEFYPGKGG